MNEELKGLYNDLLEIVRNYNQALKGKKNTLTIYPAIKGSDHAKIMVVGRAVNSWCPLQEDVEQIDICSRCTLDWIVNENYYTHCIKNGCKLAQKKQKEREANIKESGKKPRKIISNSKFWQFVRYIVKWLRDNSDSENWTKEVIASNLYKASFQKGGNPKGFYYQQLEICDKILAKEIEFYNPEIIIFVTEKNSKKSSKFELTWFVEKDSSKSNKNPEKFAFKETYDVLRKKYADKFLITKRPEMRGFESVIEEAIKFRNSPDFIIHSNKEFIL